jgi:hypothetical protein
MSSQSVALQELRAKKNALLRQRIEQEALGEHIQALVRQPNPIIGWEGNPWFTVSRHKLLDRIEIWYEKPGEEQLVAHAPMDPPPDLGAMLKGLMEWGDGRRISMEDKLQKIDDHNDRIEAAEKQRAKDQYEEAVDTLALAAHKDIDGFRKRLY